VTGLYCLLGVLEGGLGICFNAALPLLSGDVVVLALSSRIRLTAFDPLVSLATICLLSACSLPVSAVGPCHVHPFFSSPPVPGTLT